MPFQLFKENTMSFAHGSSTAHGSPLKPNSPKSPQHHGLFKSANTGSGAKAVATTAGGESAAKVSNVATAWLPNHKALQIDQFCSNSETIIIELIRELESSKNSSSIHEIATQLLGKLILKTSKFFLLGISREEAQNHRIWKNFQPNDNEKESQHDSDVATAAQLLGHFITQGKINQDFTTFLVELVVSVLEKKFKPPTESASQRISNLTNSVAKK